MQSSIAETTARLAETASHLAETASRLAELPRHLLAAQERSWFDIPGVRIVGAILGTVLLLAALRSMFGRR